MRRSIVTFLFSLFLLTAPKLCFAQPTIDSILTASVKAGTATVTSDAFTVGATSNKVLVVVLTIDMNDTGAGVTNVVWDAAGVNEALTVLLRCPNTNGFTVEFWYRKAPTAATTKVVSVTRDFAARTSSIGAYVLSDVDQTTTFRTPACSSGGGATSAQSTVTDSANTDLVIDGVYTAGTAPTDPVADMGQTERWDINALVPDVTNWFVSSTKTATGANTTMGYTWTNNGGFAHEAIAVKQFAAAASATRNLLLLGVR